jgi:hypothetical protein
MDQYRSLYDSRHEWEEALASRSGAPETAPLSGGLERAWSDEQALARLRVAKRQVLARLEAEATACAANAETTDSPVMARKLRRQRALSAYSARQLARELRLG